MVKNYTSFNWESETVLIADDDHYIHLLLEKVISRTGARIFHAYNGSEAIQVLINNPISVAILDILMPQNNGIEVVNQVKSKCESTLFVAYTADIVRHNRKMCLEAGFAHCLPKPILPIRLLAEIDSLLLPAKKSTL